MHYVDFYVDGSWIASKPIYIPGQISDNAFMHELCILDQESYALNLTIPTQQELNQKAPCFSWRVQ